MLTYNTSILAHMIKSFLSRGDYRGEKKFPREKQNKRGETYFRGRFLRVVRLSAADKHCSYTFLVLINGITTKAVSPVLTGIVYIFYINIIIFAYPGQPASEAGTHLILTQICVIVNMRRTSTANNSRGYISAANNRGK